MVFVVSAFGTHLFDGALSGVGFRLIVALLITAAVGVAGFATRSRWAPIGRLLDRLALSFSDPHFLVFDRLAIGFYLAILTLFVLQVSAGIHGSGISSYRSRASADPSLEPIAGTAKPVRGDEWSYHTPAILYQIYRPAPFSAETSALGRDHASLISNIPVRHFTTIFRPQFWGFFVLPPAYGFSFYWQFKAMLLTTGVFSLLLLLTRSSRIALFGTLWYVWSAYTQWTYSWPSLLPEMIGLFCVTICSLFYMSTGRRRALLLAAALLCVACAINFALCAYVPHQIPLVWLGIFLSIWWIWARRSTIWSPEYAGERVLALAFVVLTVGFVMRGFYLDAERALEGIANTVYPGRRSLPGGTYQLAMLGSHFFPFWMEDGRIPRFFANICESAGFIWLAPITLFFMNRTKRGESDKLSAYWILATFGAFLFIWLTVPMPEAIGQALLLNKTGTGRSMHVLGLVNIALVSL